METKTPDTFQVPQSSELRKSQLEWLDDDLMKSEVRKLSSELKSKNVDLDEYELDLCATTEPTVKSDYLKETRDGIKEIEIDGKMYRQKYQRHIKLEKHTVKQIYTFSGDEDSILDFDVPLSANDKSPKITNETPFNLTTNALLNDMKGVLSPKIVIRSTNQTYQKQDDVENHSHLETCLDKSEISSFMNKFGETDFSELSINKTLSKDLRDSFISQWQKTEYESRPQAQCKTISCVERFKDISIQGKVLHQTTCIQVTRSLIIRSKSGEAENKSTFNHITNADDINKMPLLFKVNVSGDLVYNEKYNATTKAKCKHLSIAAGQVDALIAHACSVGINTTDDYHLFHKVFVTTYALFIKTENLLEKLIKRYMYFLNNFPTNQELTEYNIDPSVESIQEELLSAVINVIVQMIYYWSRKTTDVVENILTSFCQKIHESGNIKHSILIQNSLKDLNNRIILKQERTLVVKIPQNVLDNSNICREVPKTVLDYESRKIAEQITLLESDVFDQLELEDLLNFKAACHNPTLMKCIHFFNKLTFWVKTQLLFDRSEKYPVDREKVFNKFLDILKILKSHQNFSGYTSILYSLIDFPDKLLSKKSRQKFAEESQFINLSNKKLYLNAIQDACPPFIPLLAETFSHLTRLNEIMPSFIESIGSDYPNVNYKKMWQYFIIIQYFVVKMHLPPDKKYYQFKINFEVLTFINEFKDALSESDLFLYKEKLIRSKSKKFN